jgi:hypothetical protein
MAAARKLPVGQNWSDLDHGRAREVGEKKEEREGVRFHALPAAEMHRGDRISWRKMALAALFMGGCSVQFCSCSWRHLGINGQGKGSA